MSGRKNLVMGLWARSPFEGLEQFLASLWHTSFHGDVCVFVDEVAPALVAALLNHGIIVERLDRLAVPRMHDQSSRYFNYLDFLARHSESYANVMIADLRDLIFQSDPFEKPLPADIVFAQERCTLGDSAVNQRWVEEIYGQAIAHHLRDCPVSCSGTTFGTVPGMLRYLTAMTTELASLAGRDVLMGRGIDQGIHNFLIRMRPMLNAWCDPTDSIVATMYYVPETAVQLTPGGVLVDGRAVPVVHQWDRHPRLIEFIRNSPQFRLEATRPAPRPAPKPQPNEAEPDVAAARKAAVVAFYHRSRDADWLTPFLGSLRCAGYAGGLHCVGAFDATELAVLARHGCIAHQIDAPDPSLSVENVAHLFISRVLDELAADGASRPDQVLVMDTVRAGFLRDPFQSGTIGLSVFQETATRIGDDEYNLQRLVQFVKPDADALQHPIISSSLLRGRLDIVRGFYRKLFVEFVGRAELLRIPQMMQGAVNKLCHGTPLDVPVILHPNGAEAYFEIWEAGLPVRLEPPVRVAGAVPFVVLNPVRETELMQAVRARVGL